MNDKYKYMGMKNTKCPLCSKRFDIGPPIIFLKTDGSKCLEHRWCESCFEKVHRIWAQARSERWIEQEFLPKLTQIVKDHIPVDYVVSGCWFATVPKQGLTLVMEVKDADNY